VCIFLYSATGIRKNMNRDAYVTGAMELQPSAGLPNTGPELPQTPSSNPTRMQYRSRPVSVAVDPISLVISECISITSAVQKYARSPHSSVSAILGGNPNPIQLGPPSPALRGESKSSTGTAGSDADIGLANRWGLRGKRGKSMQDNPLMAGFGKLRHELGGIKGMSQLPHLSEERDC
jgi:golgi-specific brefeldin A-resistance guanine nucleotide exchange factor 1